jgi:hypothetical protein
VAELDAGTKTTRPTTTSWGGRTSQSTTRDSTAPGNADERNRAQWTAQSEAEAETTDAPNVCKFRDWVFSSVLPQLLLIDPV